MAELSKSYINSDILSEQCSKAGEVLREEYRKYLKNTILYNILQDLEQSVELDLEVRKKLKNCLLNSQCSQVLNIEDGSSTILGIQLPEVDLSLAETDYLKIKVEHKLKDAITDLGKSNSFNKIQQEHTWDLSNEEKEVINLQKNLLEKQKAYFDNVKEKDKLLEEARQLRQERLPQALNMCCSEAEAQVNLDYQKSKILIQKLNIDIIKETELSPKAYEQFYIDLQRQQNECKSDIEELLKKKKKYESLDSKQYKEYLKSYTLSSIGNKKLLNNLVL